MPGLKDLIAMRNEPTTFCFVTFFMWTDITMKPFNQLQYFTP